MKGWVQRHAPDFLLALFAILIGLVVIFGTDSRCHAEDLGPAPFKLTCPTPARCGTHAGMWVSTQYLRKVAADVTLLEGCTKARTLFEAEIAQHQKALEAALLRLRVVEEQLIERTRDSHALSRARDDDRKIITTRTRWAVIATVVAVVLAGGIGASAYAAGH